MLKEVKYMGKKLMVQNILLMLFVFLVCFVLAELFFRNYLTGDSIEDIYATSWFKYKEVKRTLDRQYLIAQDNSAYYLTPALEEDYSDNKDKYIIIVIGDSFTQGIGLIDETKRFTRRLQEELGEDYLVINLGWGGADIDSYQRIAELYFKEHGANLTIIAYFPNDINSDIIESRGFEELYFLRPFIKHSAFIYYAKRAIENRFQIYLNYYKEAFRDDLNLAAHRRSLSKLISFSQYMKSDVLVVSIPFLYQLESFDKYPMVHQIEFISNVSSQMNASFLDLYPYFQGYDPEEVCVSRFDQHPSALGHRLIADAIYSKLLEMEVIKG